MTADERRTWLKVARETLKGIPEDLLQRGAAYARLHADHPAKIIPLIMREIEAAWETRKRVAREDTRRPAPDAPALPAPQVGGVPHEVTQAILKEVGLSLRTDEAKQ